MTHLARGIRKLASRGQHGHPCTPRHFYMVPGGCSFYWDNHEVFASEDEWDAACALLKRYQRFCRHAEGWTPTGDVVHYADNSIEREERSRSGNVRWSMVLAPGGDACF